MNININTLDKNTTNGKKKLFFILLCLKTFYKNETYILKDVKIFRSHRIIFKTKYQLF